MTTIVANRMVLRNAQRPDDGRCRRLRCFAAFLDLSHYNIPIVRIRPTVCASVLSVCLAIGASTAHAADPALAQLTSQDPTTVVQAIRALKTDPFPDEVVPILLRLVGDKNPQVRIAAMEFWGDHAPEAYDEMYYVSLAEEPGFVDLKNLLPKALETQAESADEQTRRAAIRTFCAVSMDVAWICPVRRRCGDTDAIETTFFNVLCRHAEEWAPVTDALIDDANPNVVYSALQMSAIRGVPAPNTGVIQAKVTKMLRSDNRFFRALGVEFFQPKSQSDAIRTFEPLLNDPDEDVADAASRAAAGKISLSALVDRLNVLSSDLRALIGREINESVADPGIDTETRKHITLDLMRDDDPKVRAAGMEAAEVLKLDFSEAELRTMLRSDVGSIRAEALVELLAKSVSDSKSLVANACEDPDEDVRRNVVRIAVEMKDASLAPSIMKAFEMGLGDNSWFVDPFFTSPGNEAYLDRAIRSNDPLARLAAAQSMQGDIKYLDRLLAMSSERDPEVLSAVINGIANGDNQNAADALESIVERTNGDLLDRALEALADTKQVSAIPFLRKYLDNPDRNIRRTAKRALMHLAEMSINP